MGVKTYAQDYETPVDPGRMFQALVIDADSIIPQLLPDSVKKIEKEAGSIIITQLTNGSIIKHKIDAIDTEGLTYKYTLLEGEIINGKCDSITYEVKFQASDNGGCIIKMKGGCCTRGTVPCEADLDSDKACYLGLYKAVETYLLANPITATA